MMVVHSVSVGDHYHRLPFVWKYLLNAFLEQTSENNNAAAAAIVVDAAAIGAIVAGADVVDGVVPAITAVVAVSVIAVVVAASV